MWAPRLLSIAGYLALLAALFGLLLSRELIATPPFLLALQIAAILLMIWARITFGARSFHLAADPTPGLLITHGPYHFLRHPIYAAILLFLWAAIASHPAPRNFALGLLALAGALARLLSEERLLRARCPDYAAYAARTKRLLPFVY